MIYIYIQVKKKAFTRNSAYAVTLTYDRHTTFRHNISRESSIEHPSVGLASLAQSREISIEHPGVGLASLAQSREISIEHPSVGLASLAQLLGEQSEPHTRVFNRDFA